MIKQIILFFFIFFLQQVYANEITGFPKIIDGDTVHVNLKKIRLEGIDAPEIRQMCKKNKKNYACGKIARDNLKEKIGNMKIRCISSGKDRYRRYLGTCFIKTVNLNKWMVKNGNAVAYRRYSKEYTIDEEFAKNNKLGIWSGTFIQPEKWRKLN